MALDGIYVKPRRNSKTALIWVHGLGSRFYSGHSLIKEISSAAAKAGIGYFNFNNRGHDTVNRDGASKKRSQGRAFEKFEDCAKDIKAVIKEARRLGFRDIILAGHSTGANKIVYYLYKTKDRSIKGLILAAGLSDISAAAKDIGMQQLKRRVKIVEKLARKNPDTLIPKEFGLYSCARYLSLFQSGRNEDTFPYYDPRGSWKVLKSIHVPVAAIFGAKDPYMDRPAKDLVEIFQRNAIRVKSFSGFAIPGADHSFTKKEKGLSKIIVNWIKSL